MHHSGVPPYPFSAPQRILEVADRFNCLTKYFEGVQPLDVVVRTNAMCVAAIMDGGTGSVMKLLTVGNGKVRQLPADGITTESFLVHFGSDSRRIAADATDAWRTYFEDVCHRIGDLRILASGMSLSQERHDHSRHFFRELAFWTAIERA